MWVLEHFKGIYSSTGNDPWMTFESIQEYIVYTPTKDNIYKSHNKIPCIGAVETFVSEITFWLCWPTDDIWPQVGHIHEYIFYTPTKDNIYVSHNKIQCIEAVETFVSEITFW